MAKITQTANGDSGAVVRANNNEAMKTVEVSTGLTGTGVVGDPLIATGLANIVEDITPQLGGNLDLNGNVITGLEIGTNVQAWSSVLDATTASFLTADETKLDNIEDLADVTDEANVVSSLSGATLTGVTVAGTDKVIVQDVSDSDNVKTVTAQSIADLGGGAGSVVFISETIISGTPTTVDITSGIDSTYDTYIVDVIGLTPSTDGANMQMRITTDGGSTFKSGASDYQYHTWANTTTAATYAGTNATTTNVQVGFTMGNGSGDSYNAQFTLHNPSSSTEYFQWDWQGAQKRTTTGKALGGIGQYAGATTAVDGFQFLLTTGTFAGGTIRLYGISKS